MKTFDIDIDTDDRQKFINCIDHVDAYMMNGSRKHPSGIYVNPVPTNPITGLCLFDFEKMEELGYMKIDVLNQSVYKLVKSPQELEELVSKEPNWELLKNRNFVSKLVHIGSYYDLIKNLPEPITCLEELGMFLAIIRPGKRNLIGKKWEVVKESVWKDEDNGKYMFKKSHALAYGKLVMLHMNILVKDGNQG